MGFAVWAADPLTGPEILAKVDETMSAPLDQELEATLILIDKDGNRKERTIQMLQKGPDMRLSRFLSPADQRGISVLSLPDNVIYLYLPAFKKVKRIASHIKNNRFAGTDFTYDDMEAKKLTEHYSARLVKTEEDRYVLELTPLKPGESDVSRQLIWVRKGNFVTVVVEYYNKKGTLTRKMVSEGIEKIDGYWVAREREMIDLIKNHRTKMVMNNIKFDSGLTDEIFSKRYFTR